jgi:hypothetical protein
MYFDEYGNNRQNERIAREQMFVKGEGHYMTGQVSHSGLSQRADENGMHQHVTT